MTRFVPGGCSIFTVNLLECSAIFPVDHIDTLRNGGLRCANPPYGLSAGAGAAATQFVGKAFPHPKTDSGSFVGGLAAKSIVGGLASVAGGGKFENGAVTAAFGYLYNECLHVGCGTTRVLTQGEIGIANTEFPDLDTNLLRISYYQSGSAAFTRNNTMDFPEFVSDCMDFSSCRGGDLTGWFVHEVAHTWQYQNGVNPIFGHIFSGDIFKFSNYLARAEYFQITDPSGLSTERQADWHKWHYLCTNRPGCGQ